MKLPDTIELVCKIELPLKYEMFQTEHDEDTITLNIIPDKDNIVIKELSNEIHNEPLKKTGVDWKAYHKDDPRLTDGWFIVSLQSYIDGIRNVHTDIIKYDGIANRFVTSKEVLAWDYAPTPFAPFTM